jgi:hypothetical protein
MVRPQGTIGNAALNSIVVTGVATAAAPPPTVESRRFEAARAASKQRAVTNLAVADEADASANGAGRTSRRVGSRTFMLQGEKWVDSRRADSLQVVKVRAFSEAWFKLIETIPELKEAFALGDKVIVAGRRWVIETSADGKESLSDSELKAIQSNW